jgi:hypothetical protein
MLLVGGGGTDRRERRMVKAVRRGLASGMVVEAWGPNRAACLSQAVHGLMATFTDASCAVTSERASVHLDPADDVTLLAALAEEVLSLLHVLGVVPVDGAVVATEDGGLAGCFDVAPVGRVGLVGPLPRTVSSLHVERGDDGTVWRCALTVATAAS